MPPELDAADRELLALVQRDARTPQAALGVRVGLSAAAVNRRLRRLADTGVISRICAVLSPEALGHPLTVIAHVEVDSERADLLDAVESSFTRCPQVQQCYYVTGEWDYVLVMVVRDMDEYTRLTRELFSGQPNVKRFTTMVAMTRSKVTLEVPLDEDRR